MSLNCFLYCLLLSSLEFNFFFWHFKFIFTWLFGASILRWTRIASNTDAWTHTILLNKTNEEEKRSKILAEVMLSKRTSPFLIYNFYKYSKIEDHLQHIAFIKCGKLCWISMLFKPCYSNHVLKSLPLFFRWTKLNQVNQIVSNTEIFEKGYAQYTPPTYDTKISNIKFKKCLQKQNMHEFIKIC